MNYIQDQDVPLLWNEHIWSEKDFYGLCECERCRMRRLAFNKSFRYISWEGVVDDYDADEEQPLCLEINRE